MTTKNKNVEDRIVEAILNDVTDRRGWRQEWDGFDDGTKAEIQTTWKKIIQKELKK